MLLQSFVQKARPACLRQYTQNNPSSSVATLCRKLVNLFVVIALQLLLFWGKGHCSGGRGKTPNAERRTPNALFACAGLVSLVFACG